MTNDITYTCEKCGDTMASIDLARQRTHLPARVSEPRCDGRWLIGTPHLRLRILGVEGDQVKFQIADQKWRGIDFDLGSRMQFVFHYWMASVDYPRWHYGDMCHVPYLGVRGTTTVRDAEVLTMPMTDFPYIARSVQAYCVKAEEWEALNAREDRAIAGLHSFEEWHLKYCPTVTDLPACELPNTGCNGNFRWGYGGVFGIDSVRIAFAGKTCREVFDSLRKPEPLRCDECGGEGIIRSTVTSGPGQWCMACWDKRQRELAAVKAEDEKAKEYKYDHVPIGGPTGKKILRSIENLTAPDNVSSPSKTDDGNGSAPRPTDGNPKPPLRCRYAEPVEIEDRDGGKVLVGSDPSRDHELASRAFDIEEGETWKMFRAYVARTQRTWPTCRYGGTIRLHVELAGDFYRGYYLCDRCSKVKA